ncbi:MAG: hypothetical protein KF819_25190 [Labilithrix sp.]|nr:hypothetical protein [Labilithrix sp.]
MLEIDLMDPETLLAFFGEQMKDVRGKLAVAMQDQEDRNTRINELGALENKLTAFIEKGITPGDPKWAEFAETAKALQDKLGDSAAGTQLQDLLAKCLVGQVQVHEFDDPVKCKEFMDARANAGGYFKILSSNDPIRIETNAPYGLDNNEVKRLQDTIKGFRDRLQGDNSMNMIRVQQLVEQSSQIMNLCSNIMKKLNDMAMAPINNMR